VIPIIEYSAVLALGFAVWLLGRLKPQILAPLGGFGGAIDASPKHPNSLDGGLVVAGLALLYGLKCARRRYRGDLSRFGNAMSVCYDKVC
jgi:hypothetical protein